VLWRHGQTTWNLEQRYQGQTDIPLDETGMAQAEYAAKRLATLRPDAIISSDLIRAQQTAGALARLTGLPVTLNKELRERSGGGWEGLLDSEIRQRFPAERTSWNPPGGETDAVVADRVSAAFTNILDDMGDVHLYVVASHGGALRLGMERILGLPPRILGPLVNCSWSVLGFSDQHWRLMEYNSTSVPEPVLGDDR